MNMCCTRSNNIKNELKARQSERPPQATDASVASSDARPDTSGDLSVSKHKDERQWREMTTSYRYADTPLLSAYFYTPGPFFVFSSVNRPCIISPAPVRTFSGLNSLKSIPLPCHAHWSKVWYFSLLTLFNFSATVLIRIEEVSRPVRPCVLCVRR